MPEAMDAKLAEPRTDAVAPVAMSVGACSEVETASRRSGIVAWPKTKKPRLGRSQLLIGRVFDIMKGS